MPKLTERGTDHKTRLLSIKVEAGIKDKLAALAARQDRSISYVAKKILQKGVSQFRHGRAA